MKRSKNEHASRIEETCGGCGGARCHWCCGPIDSLLVVYHPCSCCHAEPSIRRPRTFPIIYCTRTRNRAQRRSQSPQPPRFTHNSLDRLEYIFAGRFSRSHVHELAENVACLCAPARRSMDDSIFFQFSSTIFKAICRRKSIRSSGLRGRNGLPFHLHLKYDSQENGRNVNFESPQFEHAFCAIFLSFSCGLTLTYE